MDRRNFLETSLTIGAGGVIAPSLLNEKNKIMNSIEKKDDISIAQ